MGRAGGAGATTSYAYALPNDGRLSQLKHDMAASANDLTLDFTYSPASQIATRASSNDLYSWTSYVSQNVADVVNGLNQLTLSGGTSITHDGRGNLTSDGTSTYTYDAANR